MQALFENRYDAGSQLGDELIKHSLTDPLVLALPRGGVVVAQEVADKMHASMDVIIARKIGAPGHPEYGIGALSEDGAPVFNPYGMGPLRPDQPEVQKIVKQEFQELQRRINLYRHGQSLTNISGRSVIVIDDGLATGVTAVAAAKFLRTLGPKELILAVPVGPREINPDLRRFYDDIICLHALDDFRGVGRWYEDFDQVEDEEVLSILAKFHQGG